MQTKFFKQSWLTAVLVAVIAGACSKNKEEIDTEYPEIDIAIQDAFPIQCSEITRGVPFTFKAKFTDNKALGSFSLDIHHNFDQHSHSTEVMTCLAAPVKQPENAYVFIQSFEIPENSKEYTANVNMLFPVDADPGDYHFMIKVTDKEGWQTIKGLSIKVI
ncbi:DUF4625 domain-containing protein [Gynurincola endophyticus]|jgi:hypothetical protein|uniref:DUF4625 domain-containing protein n=1 Tax=Gynurincola endophyticus TaxID=2479004 RepID=UPI000F8F7A94|nr:DUF4625 domain-containing protein [Gynurincola endophyticus]